MNTINHNLMAVNVARNLNSHYGKLATSVERLSSGLRINSAADDAAGLAIREMMRADVAALNQGVRNASDAISMLQVADGALAIIDEKLIRMKELAEQAATGTYDSTQRLMIDSEYKAMAAEIDRIARATDFNGIKLLDGSLSGAHNGAGLTSTGAMKIHFGSANDSAEDYYYVTIGDCTAKGLGLDGTLVEVPPQITYIRQETVGEIPETFKPILEYEIYKTPGGSTYYRDGENFFTNLRDPVGTRVTSQDILQAIKPDQRVDTTRTDFNTYIDPVTNTEYYSANAYYDPTFNDYTTDPYDPVGKRLDRESPDFREIVNRLQRDPGNKRVEVTIAWSVWRDENGKEYYSYNNGVSFVPDKHSPGSNVLDSTRPDDKAIIDALEETPGTREISLPSARYDYDVYSIPGGEVYYYSRDGGKTFVKNANRPDETMLDPVKDKDIISRLQLVAKWRYPNIRYVAWETPDGKNTYYTADGGITFIASLQKPYEITLRNGVPEDQIIIASLVPSISYAQESITCNVYEDRANGNKQYYSWNNGQSYFDDIANPMGSLKEMSNPANAGMDDNFQKVDSTVRITTQFVRYKDPVTDGILYSADGGNTFYIRPYTTRLEDATVIGRLVLSPRYETSSYRYGTYTDPFTGLTYYAIDFRKQQFITDVNHPENIALDYSRDQNIIDRLEPVKQTSPGFVRPHLPNEYEVYEVQGSSTKYYTSDGGQTFFKDPFDPASDSNKLDPAADSAILNQLKPMMTVGTKVEYIEKITPGYVISTAATISTQQLAQQSLVSIDRAIVSKDKIRAHLGAMQNRLENTVTNLTIQAENMQNAESRISDADVANEMTTFVRNQILTQSAVAMLGQANSYPHMLMGLING